MIRNFRVEELGRLLADGPGKEIRRAELLRCFQTIDRDIGEEALKRGADVFVLPRGKMPTPSPIAAIFRF